MGNLEFSCSLLPMIQTQQTPPLAALKGLIGNFLALKILTRSCNWHNLPDYLNGHFNKIRDTFKLNLNLKINEHQSQNIIKI